MSTPPPPHALAPTARPPLSGITVTVALALAWLGLFESARLLEYAPHASLWFPPVGLTYAAFVVWRGRALAGIAVAAMVGTAITAVRLDLASPWSLPTLQAGAGYALSHALPLWVLAEGTRWATRQDTAGGFGSRPTLVFLLGGGLACLLTAVMGSTVLAASGFMPGGDLLDVGIPWMIGDYAGLLTLGPLAAWVARRWRDRQLAASITRVDLPWLAKLGLLLAMVSAVMAVAALNPAYEPAVFMIVFALAVQQWITHGHHPVLAMASLAGAAVAIAALTSPLGLGDHALKLQFAIIALALSTLSTLSLTALNRDNQRLRDLLRNDPLSGALSRAFFLEQAQHAIDDAEDRGAPLTLLMLDMDHLKAINDRLGHAAGDDAIRRTAATISAALDEGEWLGRLGGDEFALCLPGTSATHAATRATAILSALRAASQADCPLGASAGLAEHRTGESLRQLLARADRALLDAKRNGRGQVRVAED